MKDYDDLWRLSKSEVSIDSKKLKTLARKRDITLTLDTQWIGADLDRMWESHRKRYKDLPQTLREVFGDVNSWLQKQ